MYRTPDSEMGFAYYPTGLHLSLASSKLGMVTSDTYNRFRL